MATKDVSFKNLVNTLATNTSVLVGRARLANLIGKTFDGKRDLFDVLGYKRILAFDDYDQRYRRGGIAGRVVDTYPHATWRNPPRVLDKGKQEHEKQGKFPTQFNILAERLNLFHYMERVDKLAGVGRYAILLIGTKGGRDLKQPMGSLTSPDDVLFVSPYSEGNAAINSYVTEVSDPRFGLPKTYLVTLNKDLNVGESIGRKQPQNIEVHHSRVLHVADNLVEDDIFGLPRLFRNWNYLDDLDKIVGGSAEAVWRTVDRGLQFDVDKDMDLDPDAEDAFADEIEEYMHNLKRYIRTKGIKTTSLGGDNIDVSSPFEATMQLISGTSGIPVRILLGSERGQLASSSDDRNFNSRVKERQQSFAGPVILRPFINKLMINGAFGTGKKEFSIKWPDVSTLTEREKADVAARYAQAISHVSKQDKDNLVMDVNDFRKRFIED